MKITTAKGKVKDIDALKPSEGVAKAYQLVSQQAPIATVLAVLLRMEKKSQTVIDSVRTRQLLKGEATFTQIKNAEKVIGALPFSERQRKGRVTDKEIAKHLGGKYSADHIGRMRRKKF